MKEARASAPAEEADIVAELAGSTDESELEEEDADSDMGGGEFGLPGPYADHEAQHSLAGMQHSEGQAVSTSSNIMLISGMHSVTATTHVQLLKQLVCDGILQTDKLTEIDHLLSLTKVPLH